MPKNPNILQKIEIPCSLELYSGLIIQGTTREISVRSLFLESQGFSLQGRDPPEIGEIGTLRLYLKRGHIIETVQIRGRILSVLAHGLGLSINFAGLDARQRRIVQHIMHTGSDVMPKVGL